jgi:Tol biopolymer transport system component
MTQAGVILGTAAYMSPEQARGKAVDRRTDLWAFGCVLYEMLTGERAFDGETITDVLSAIVRAEPDWSKLPRETPAIVHRLLHRCLVKDARNRQQSAGDVRIEIDEALAGAAERASPAAVAIPAARRGRWVPALGVAAAAAITASGITWMWARANVGIPDRPPLRFTIDLPRGTGVVNPVVSRDGRRVAIGTRDELGRQQIWVRALDGVAFEPVPGAAGGVSPFWSADGSELGFFNAGKLMRIAAWGGTPREVVDLGWVLGATPNGSLPANWGADGTILLGTIDGVYRVPVEGGEPARIAAGAETSAGPLSSYSWPFVLPDHDALLYTAITGGNLGDGALMFQTLAGGAPIRLRANRTRAHYTPDGLLLARLNGAEGLGRASLTVHRFDPAQPAVEEPGVELSSDASLNFGASDTGVIVYMPARANADYRFEWVDASGRPTGDGFATVGSNPFNLSRDEHLLAFVESGDIFLRDLRRGVTTRLVAGPAVLEPILSPDGGRIAYSVTGGSERGIAVRPTAGGTSQLVYKSEQAILVEDWSADGRFLAANGGGSGLIIPLDTGQAPMVYANLSPGVNPDEPRFSPDGRWLVYNAADSGRQEVYLVPVPPTGERWQLSVAGGAQGRFRRDGKEVFYLASTGELIAVELETAAGGSPRIGRPRTLFDTGLVMASNIDQFAVTADGTRFLLRRPASVQTTSQLNVIVNWPSLIAPR